MGLFSTFIKLSGAKECVGIDVDPDIIRSARILADAFEVNNKYYIQNFNDVNNAWEDQFTNFDFVIALSVINWLNNKERFLNFLGLHNEVLYEGHDRFEIEYARLKRHGFNCIEVISISERGRILFYARQRYSKHDNAKI